MNRYQYREHGQGYQIGKSLRAWRPQYQIILSWVEKGSKVLDIGCGDGVLGEKLIKEKGCVVYGVDLDQTAVKEAKKRGIKASILDIDDGLKFKDKTFDVVIMTEVIQFVKNSNFALSETLRVGKTVIIAFPNFGFWFYRLQLLLGKFPTLALYGHSWWETSQIRFFSYLDFLSLPALKKASIEESFYIDWKNRSYSFLAKLSPNLFARSCIIKLQ